MRQSHPDPGRLLIVRVTLLFVVLIAVWASPGHASSLADLRTQLERRGDDTLNAADAKELGTGALTLAADATSRASFFSAISFVADVCDAADPHASRDLRDQALTLLAGNFSDTMRWSSFVTNRFVPTLWDIDKSQWSDEIASYDRLLSRLYAASTNERVRAELLYARVRIRVHIERRWDWLTLQARQHAVAILDTLVMKYGDLPCPGHPDNSVRKRAGPDYNELEKLHFGAPAPATSGTDLSSRKINIADHNDQVVVLDFWTSFCQPCLAMVPDIRKLLAQFSNDPVVYIGVNGDTDRQQAIATTRKFNMTWRNLWDGPKGPYGPASTTWNVPSRGWPTVFVIDAQGRVRYKLVGQAQIQAELEPAIAKLLAESNH